MPERKSIARDADDDDDDAFIARVEAELAVRETAIRTAFEVSPAIVVRYKGHRWPQLVILSGGMSAEDKKYRITKLLPDGPVGHETADTVSKLAGEIAYNLTSVEPVDEDFVMDWTSTPEFEEGAKKVTYVQAANMLGYLASGRGLKWIGAIFDQANKLAHDDIEAATELLRRATRKLQIAPAQRR